MIRFWQSWWKEPPNKTIKAVTNDKPKEIKPKPINMKKKYAIVVGHTKLRPGACSPYGIPCEWTFNKKVASYLTDIADIYYYDSYNGGYKSMVRRNANKMNKKDYDLVIELHYNAGVQIANGTECFYYVSNKKGKKKAEEFCKAYCKEFATKNRGAKAMYSKKQRGFWALYYPKATALLLEPFFGSNFKNVSVIKGKEEAYANVIRTTLFK